MVQGFGGLRMLGGKLRISPNLPKAWKKLSYTLLWKGQSLAVTVSPEMVEIINQTGSAPISLEVWGEDHTFDHCKESNFSKNLNNKSSANCPAAVWEK